MNDKKRRNTIKSVKGFTLVELSIVLVIIGLIVGGIVGGQSLIRSAKVSKVIQQVQQYQSAFRTFDDQYQYLPGDLPDAWEYWGNDCYVTSSSSYKNSYCNGNGDGLITPGNMEHWKVWEHLTLAKMIPGSYEGAAYSAPTKPGTNVPIGPLDDSIFVVYAPGYGNERFRTRSGSMLAFYGSDSGSDSGYVLTNQEAYMIDKKIDDGHASTGEIYTWGYYYGGGRGCVSAGYTSSASPTYTLANETISCKMGFWITR